jgi:predicted secreted hydrolase
MKEQELALKPIAYWEGMIDASGARAGKPLRGRGYMELTGYAGALVGLSSGSR